MDSISLKEGNQWPSIWIRSYVHPSNFKHCRVRDYSRPCQHRSGSGNALQNDREQMLIAATIYLGVSVVWPVLVSAVMWNRCCLCAPLCLLRFLLRLLLISQYHSQSLPCRQQFSLKPQSHVALTNIIAFLPVFPMVLSYHQLHSSEVQNYTF